MATRPAGWVNPADYVRTNTTPAPYPGNPEQFSYDPTAVGGGVAQYYGTVTSALPTYEAIQRNIAGIPTPEERRLIAQAAAERGIGIGSYGGPNDQTAYLRALGLTSRALTNLGIEQYGKQMATIPALSPTNLFVTPTDLSRMQLDWGKSQAEINAAMARQRASDQAALERARLAARTSSWQTAMELGSRERMDASQRAAAEEYNRARLSELALAQQRQGQVAALANQYGVGGYNPWGGGVSTPGYGTTGGGGAGENLYGSYGAEGYTGTTGSTYFGAGFPDITSEYEYMQELGGGTQYYDPYDAFLNQEYYAPGEAAYAYSTGAPPTAEDYYYGFE